MTGRPIQPTPGGWIAARLARLGGQIRTTQAAAAQLEAERNALIRKALADGWTQAQIMRATGLSRARVGQLAK